MFTPERNKNEDEEEQLFNFENLEVYQRSVNLMNTVLDLTKEFPKRVQNSIVPQLNRAALSISLNIAEGGGNFYIKDKKRYLRIARGSVFECLPLVKISKKQKLITHKEYTEIYNELFEISCMISGLINSIDKRKDGNWNEVREQDQNSNKIIPTRTS